MDRYPLVLTLDSAGHPQRWSTWEEGVVYKVKDLIAWSLGDETVYHGGTSRVTGLESTVSVPSIVAIRNLGRTKTRSVPLTNKNLFGRDRNTCAYCGKHLVGEDATRDHIIPQSRGGANTWMNCISACKQCNNHKDCMTLEEARMQLLFVPYVPNRSEALILSNRHILADQLEFLTKTIPAHSRLH